MIKKFLFISIILYSSIIGTVFVSINQTNANSDMSSTSFMIDVNDLSPSNNKYTSWPKWNVNNILNRVTQILLVIIPSIAVLFMVVGWIKMITAWWDSSKISSAKNIITYNIIAVVMALLSYAIIQLIVWLLWSTV